MIKAELLTRLFLAKLQSTDGTDKPADGTEWGHYAESAADADGRVKLRLQWPSSAPKPPPAPPSPRAEELEAAWPAKWMPTESINGNRTADLSHDAHGVTLRIYYGHLGWTWELSADEDHYQGSTNGYTREGTASTPAAAVAALKSALREYATRLLDLAE